MVPLTIHKYNKPFLGFAGCNNIYIASPIGKRAGRYSSLKKGHLGAFLPNPTINIGLDLAIDN